MWVKQSRIKQLFSEPYIKINIILAGVVVVILLYSGIFSTSNSYPIHSYYESATGQTSPSSGLSRAFSEIVRLNFTQAKIYNRYSLQIFSFFAAQLLLRLLFSWLFIAYSKYGNRVVIADITISTAIFIYAFSPFLYFLFEEAANKL